METRGAARGEGLSEKWPRPVTPLSALQGRDQRDASRQLTCGAVLNSNTSTTLTLCEKMVVMCQERCLLAMQLKCTEGSDIGR